MFNKFCYSILITFVCLLTFFCSLSMAVEVSDFDELQDAILEDSTEDIIVLNSITVPDGTVLDGLGKTIKVATPYVDEDGQLASSPSSSNVFTISSPSTVTLKNMTIMGGGQASSGAVSSNGYLTMENVNVVRSRRGLDAYGGGTNVLINCNFSLNVCASAGAIWCGNGSTLVLDGCSFTKNRSNGGSSSGGGAIGVSGSGSHLYANNTIFANNATQEIGGAINIYDSHAYLMNCTVAGNTTEGGNSCGGGIGKNGGSFYAVNSIFVDNYANIRGSVTRSDIAIYSNSNNMGLYNCLYGVSGKAGTNCLEDTSTQVATSYVNGGIILSNGDTSSAFTHPTLIEGENEYDLYVGLKQNGVATSGGIVTYFDYSDTQDIKMGYGDSDDIASLGGLPIPDEDSEVTTYFEGDTRDSDYIGASSFAKAPITTWEQLRLALIAGGEVKLTQDINCPPDGTEIVIPDSATTTLDLNGYIINRNFVGGVSYGKVISVNGGNLTIEDSMPNRTHTPEVSYYEPISGDKVIVSGGILTGGYRGIFVINGGTVTMNAGTIYGNNLDDVYDNSGAGVLLQSGATFNMNGGSIENNSAPKGNGGAVYIYYGSTFNMAGGIIKNNTCGGNGAGFFLYDNQSSRAKLYLTGGTITRNKSVGDGGAINVNSNGGVLYVSGNPVVEGNKKGDIESNITGPGDTYVNIVGEMTEGAHIGVTTSSVPTLEYSPRFTNDYSTYNEGKDPGNYFFSDYGEEIVTTFDYVNEPCFAYPVTTWEELRTSFGHYGGIKLTCDIVAPADATQIRLGWCGTCLDLNGHVIDVSAIESDITAFYLSNGHSDLTIMDSNPTATHNPPLTYVDPVTEEIIVVNGGIITGRPSGVFIGNEVGCGSGVLKINGGTILGKSVPGAYSLWVDYGTIYMNGGTVCGNTSSADCGGGVKIQSAGTMYLNGGTITGNASTNAGAGIWNFGRLYIDGGTVTNNVSNDVGGGIYSEGTLTLQGKVVVSGNKYGEEDNNLYLQGNAMTITGAIDEDSSVGITTRYAPSVGNNITFTSDYSTYNEDVNPSDLFTSDRGDAKVVLDENGEASLELVVKAEIKGNSVQRTSATDANIKFYSNSDGTYYYIVTDSETQPTADEIKEASSGIYGSSNAITGTNTISLSNLETGAQYVHLVVFNGLDSDVLTIEMPYDVYYFEDFESYPIDTYISSGALSPMYQRNNGNGNENQKVVARSDEGQMLNLSSAGGLASDQLIGWDDMIPTTGKYVFEGDVRTTHSSTETPDWLLRFSVNNGSYGANYEAGVHFEDRYIYNIKEDVILKDSFEKDTWYHIKVEIFPTKSIYYVYVDGEKSEALALPSGLSSMAISAGHGHTAFFDNLKFYTSDDRMIGDLNQDSLITIVDVRMLLERYINAPVNASWSEDELYVMDIDRDGFITIVDVRFLLNIYITI